MMKMSAGLLVYRVKDKGVDVFLVHPGGPLWVKKDDGAWSIPKGEYTSEENPLEAAKREFREETGFEPPSGKMMELKPLKQPSGKVVSVWAVEGDYDAREMSSSLFSMEWPPKSGKQQEFPEVDRAGWFSLEEARVKIFTGQTGFLDQLSALSQL